MMFNVNSNIEYRVHQMRKNRKQRVLAIEVSYSQLIVLSLFLIFMIFNFTSTCSYLLLLVHCPFKARI